MTYLNNLKAWYRGWSRFSELDFKPGWSGKQLRWKLTYAINHGTRVLSGGSCETWSRYFYETRTLYRISAFITRLLNHADDNHGADSGRALWGTQPARWEGVGALVFWVFILLMAVGFPALRF